MVHVRERDHPTRDDNAALIRISEIGEVGIEAEVGGRTVWTTHQLVGVIQCVISFKFLLTYVTNVTVYLKRSIF